MTAHLEHANFTVSDPAATAAWMCDLFGWHIRWQGAAKDEGHTVHVGTDAQYLALYAPKASQKPQRSSYTTIGGLNHLAVTTDDLDALETRIKAHGFMTGNHADYEPGRRFYFHDHDNIEYEVVQYG
ncbi:VOC family protein [Pseudosulfitobacter koreensis]|uniref:VOC family protein n=1 Tax=Pseudosulfitobacter koreensis TaxID=2968472 RepID=A0ABT1YZ23_9RHOB|nr:VOC family protein [Pseudosulfitobacter koreense]MCR8826101.1 VOC family protein [Pseudosulfitobacter koreense]